MGPSTQPLLARLTRRGGVAAIIGALLIAIGAYWGLAIQAGEELAVFAGEASFFLAVLVGLVGAVTLVFGLMALYAVQAEETGGFGLLAFVVAVVGEVLFAAQLFSMMAFAPSLAADAPGFLELLSEGTVTGPLGPAMLAAQIVLGIGLLLFGVATFRAEVFPRLAGVGMGIGALLTTIPVPFSNLILIGATIWMGFLVATGRVDASTGQTRPTAERTPATAGSR